MNKERSRYVFGAALAGVALGGVPGLVGRAHAALTTAAQFTFDTSGTAFSTSVTQGAVAYGPIIAEVGSGSAYGSHAATNAVYSSPAGNGSAHSFSSNVWAPGDYYEFAVPTTGLENILVSYDQISSSTGPKVFSLYYSVDGTNFSSFSSYSITITEAETNSTGGTGTESAWSANSKGAYNWSFDLSGLTGLNNDANALFEVVDTDVTGTSTGTDRVDNVVVAGSPVPEPASMTLLTAAAAAAAMRRRRA
ncbi:MAG TPA: PEP-CTERM sorting domain-containing protein [Tepidisphaeraceae bacterium]|jgi:hypothetical protein